MEIQKFNIIQTGQTYSLEPWTIESRIWVLYKDIRGEGFCRLLHDPYLLFLLYFQENNFRKIGAMQFKIPWSRINFLKFFRQFLLGLMMVLDWYICRHLIKFILNFKKEWKMKIWQKRCRFWESCPSEFLLFISFKREFLTGIFLKVYTISEG